MQQSPFTYLKGSTFFPRFASTVKNWSKKLMGRHNNKPHEFSTEDKQAIRDGLQRLAKEFENW